MLSRASLPIAVAAVAAAIAIWACGTRTVPGEATRPEPAEPPARGSETSEPAATEADEPEPEPPAPRVVHLALDLEDLVNANDPDAPQTRVTLVMTDQTGSARRVGLGIFDGACQDVTGDRRDPSLGGRTALLAADCWHAGAGSRIRVVRDGGELVILRAWVDEGTSEPSYDELDRAPIDPGARLITGELPD